MAIFSNAILLTLASITSRGFLFAREGFLAASLGPTNYGIWVQITTLLNYALHLPIGYQNIMSRDVPFHLASGDKKKLSAITGAAKFVTLSTALIASFFIILASFFLEVNSLINNSLYIALSTLLIIQQFNGYQSVLLRSEERFVVYSIGLVLISFIGLIGAIITVNYLGIIGPVIFQFVALFVVSSYWTKHIGSCCSNSLSDNYFNALRLWHQAFPLFIGGVIGFFIVSLDRLVIVTFYPKEDAGLYGFALVLTQSIYLVTTPVINIFNTRMMRDYGMSHTPNTLLPYLFLFSYILPMLVVFFLGLVCLFADVISGIWFPEYEVSICILKTLSLGLAPLLIASGVQMLLVAKNKEKLVMWGNIVFAIIQIFIYCACAYFGYKIEEMAWAVVVFFILYSSYYLSLFALVEDGKFAGVLYYIKRIYSPIAIYSVLVYYTVDIKFYDINQSLVLSIKMLVILVIAFHFCSRWMNVLKFLISDSVKVLIIDGKKVMRNVSQ